MLTTDGLHTLFAAFNVYRSALPATRQAARLLRQRKEEQGRICLSVWRRFVISPCGKVEDATKYGVVVPRAVEETPDISTSSRRYQAPGLSLRLSGSGQRCYAAWGGTYRDVLRFPQQTRMHNGNVLQRAALMPGLVTSMRQARMQSQSSPQARKEAQAAGAEEDGKTRHLDASARHPKDLQSSKPFKARQDLRHDGSRLDGRSKRDGGPQYDAAPVSPEMVPPSRLPFDPIWPSRSQLWRHFLNAMIPMIGFGLMDNLIMLQAGELIDTSIGVAFGLSTLTAAAVGQIFSDVSGVCFGGVVGAVAGRLGLPSAMLSPTQQRMGRVRAVGTGGRMVGVVIGCLMGMVSLLFMDLEESQRLRRFKELQPILVTITRHTKRALGVNSCRIYFFGVDQEGREALFEVGLPQPNFVEETAARAAGRLDGIPGENGGGSVRREVNEAKEASLCAQSPAIRGFSNHYTHKEAARSWTFFGRHRNGGTSRKETKIIPVSPLRSEQRPGRLEGSLVSETAALLHPSGLGVEPATAGRQAGVDPHWVVSTEKCRTDPLLKCVKIGPSSRLTAENGGSSFDRATNALAGREAITLPGRETDGSTNRESSEGAAVLESLSEGVSSTPEDIVEALDGGSESIVSFVARTGHAVMCIRHSDEASQQASAKRGGQTADMMEGGKEARTEGRGVGHRQRDDRCVTLASTSPVAHALLCYPVFDDMDRDRVIGVIELADKQPPPGSPPGTVAMFTRDDERLVRMLSEHLSLYLALGSYYKHEEPSAEGLESIEKIGWVCPEPKRFG